MSRVAALLLLAAGLPAAVRAQDQRCPPRDDAERVPALAEVRARLIEAVRQRDTATIVNAAVPGIPLGFGGDSGVASLRAMLRGSDEVWNAFQDILSHGGSLGSDSTFQAPYWTTCDADFDLVVIGSNVRVRGRPSLDAPILGALSYDIVTGATAPASLPDGWEAIRFGNGTGYVRREYLRGGVDCRLFFTRRDGRWRFSGYFCGD